MVTSAYIINQSIEYKEEREDILYSSAILQYIYKERKSKKLKKDSSYYKTPKFCQGLGFLQ